MIDSATSVAYSIQCALSCWFRLEKNAGSIPAAVGKLETLTVIDLDYNRLEGDFGVSRRIFPVYFFDAIFALYQQRPVAKVPASGAIRPALIWHWVLLIRHRNFACGPLGRWLHVLYPIPCLFFYYIVGSIYRSL